MLVVNRGEGYLETDFLRKSREKYLDTMTEQKGFSEFENLINGFAACCNEAFSKETDNSVQRFAEIIPKELEAECIKQLAQILIKNGEKLKCKITKDVQISLRGFGAEEC